jgi:hypothetical protein
MKAGLDDPGDYIRMTPGLAAGKVGEQIACRSWLFTYEG